MSGNRKQSYLQHNKYNMNLIEGLFNIIAPHQCLGCRKDGALLCYDCHTSLAPILPRCYRCGRLSDDFRTCETCRRYTSVHSLWMVTSYEGLSKEVVHQLKFERAAAGAKAIASALAARLRLDEDVIVTYVPTANRRIRQRGYDQSALIARELARLSGRSFRSCLARLGHQRQVGGSRALRIKQMQGAFRAVHPATFQNRRLLLIDDVITTGATCEVATRTLRQAGAKQVDAAVFAVA